MIYDAGVQSRCRPVSIRCLCEVLHDPGNRRPDEILQKPAGRKFIQVQDQVGRDTVNGLMGKYMPQAVKEIRDASDREIAAAKSAPTPSKSSAQSGKK